jgi:hypothetical protein
MIGRMIARRALALAASLTWLSATPAIAGVVRYVVATPGGPPEYMLWTSYTASVNCARALLFSSDPRPWCEDGIAGVRPKVGGLNHGTEVEVLDDDECRDMVHARVLTGPLRGEVGCIVGRALSPTRPELPGAP